MEGKSPPLWCLYLALGIVASMPSGPLELTRYVPPAGTMLCNHAAQVKGVKIRHPGPVVWGLKVLPRKKKLWQ